MFKFIKSNLILLISFGILLVILCANSYNYVQNNKLTRLQSQRMQQICLEDLNSEAPKNKEICEGILKEAGLSLDFYTMFTNTTIYGYKGLTYVLFLFIVMPSLFYICKYFKNRQILNESTRDGYGKTISKVIRKGYKSIVILPGIILIAFCICAFYTKTFDPAYSIYYGSTFWQESTMNNPSLFLILYFLNIVIHSILYINIGLIIARKHHNYFVAVILSFLVFIGIEAFLEIAINGVLFFSILKSDIGMIFNIMNMLAFNDVYGTASSMIVPCCLMIVSCIILYFKYKNKEALIIDCEKNE